jgi:predicted nuclease of predicted toxin-antitoxin system
LTLSLLIDECIQAKVLVEKLKTEGHDVLTAAEAGLSGVRDRRVFEFAIAKNRIILTTNCDDFISESKRVEKHPGILLVYKNSDSMKDLSYAQLVQAVRNLEMSGANLNNGCHILNRYKY